ncbi:hypothetical protein MKX01_040657 [Papaver californicum]|nr:hypothetical protein MKX01_040657 [Papaver californicum]
MGVILEFTQAVAEIVKKHKQVGTPLKIFKKTALTEDMFALDHEIDWFEGASIQTAKGVQGNTRRAAKKKLLSKLIREINL